MEFNTGDIVAFHLRGNIYGALHVVMVERLSQYDHYHCTVLDVLLNGEGEMDEFDVTRVYIDDPSSAETAPVFLNHFGITYSGLMASNVIVVGEREVEESEMEGFRLFQMLRLEDAEKRGLIRRDRDGDDVDDRDDEDGDGVVGDDPIDDGVSDGDSDGVGDEVGDDRVDEGEAIDAEVGEGGAEVEGPGHVAEGETEGTVTLYPWNTRMFDEAVGPVLLRLNALFAEEPFVRTAVGEYIASLFDPEVNRQHIAGLVQRLVEGDYAAGYELLDYGHAAADALNEQLAHPTVEVATDILQVLCDMGTDRGYHHVVQFFGQHYDMKEDPLATPAIHACLYALNVSGGQSKEFLPLLIPELFEALSYDPEFGDDARAAIESLQAMAEGKEATSKDQDMTLGQSTDPFKGM